MKSADPAAPGKASGVILTVTPNPSVDRTLDAGEVRFGEVNRARGVRVEPSGKGVNVSRALTVHGVPSFAVLPAGGAEGSQLLGLLLAEGVPHRPVPVDGPTRVNISICSGGRVTKVNEPGPALTAEEATALLDATGAAIREIGDAAGSRGPGRWVVGAGTLPAGLPPDFYAQVMPLAEESGLRFALDTSGEALSAGLEGRPALVKPNLTELEQLAGRTLPTLGEVCDAARDVRRITGGAVLVSLGARGALLVDAGGTLHARAAVPGVVNPVGGGDSLLAGFLAGLVLGLDRTGALREAMAWAAAAVLAPGSVGRTAGAADRDAVRLDTGPDPAQPSA